MAQPDDTSVQSPGLRLGPHLDASQPSLFLTSVLIPLSSFPSLILLGVTAERDLREHTFNRVIF